MKPFLLNFFVEVENWRNWRVALTLPWFELELTNTSPNRDRLDEDFWEINPENLIQNPDFEDLLEDWDGR